MNKTYLLACGIVLSICTTTVGGPIRADSGDQSDEAKRVAGVMGKQIARSLGFDEKIPETLTPLHVISAQVKNGVDYVFGTYHFNGQAFVASGIVTGDKATGIGHGQFSTDMPLDVSVGTSFVGRPMLLGQVNSKSITSVRVTTQTGDVQTLPIVVENGSRYVFTVLDEDVTLQNMAELNVEGLDSRGRVIFHYPWGRS